MRYYPLPEEGIEALTEHSLGNYLPFNGGFRQHYQIRSFGNLIKKQKNLYCQIQNIIQRFQI